MHLLSLLLLFLSFFLPFFLSFFLSFFLYFLLFIPSFPPPPFSSASPFPTHDSFLYCSGFQCYSLPIQEFQLKSQTLSINLMEILTLAVPPALPTLLEHSICMKECPSDSLARIELWPLRVLVNSV